MRKLPVISGVLVAGAMAVAACGGAASPTTGPINVPTLPPINLPTLPPINLPSIAIPSLPIGSFAIPSFAFPSFDTNADPQLAAMFPTQVGGQPVTEVQTFNYLQFVSAFGGAGADSTQAFVAALTQAGIDPSTVSIGTAKTTVDGDEVSITAFRTPNVDATRLLALAPQLQQLTDPTAELPTVGTANVGGKTVTTLTDSDGNVDYVYPHGDVLWGTDSSDQTVVGTILSALP